MRCLRCMRFCGGSFISQAQNGWAFPPPEERPPVVSKAIGWREKVDDVVKEIIGDDIAEQQGDLACANAVSDVAGVEGPPNIWLGWEGVPLSGELGTQERLCRPVQQRGLVRWCTIRRWPLTVGNGRSNNTGFPFILERTAPKYDVGQRGEDKMAVRGGKVVMGGARASCAMSLCSILARMASKGATRRSHSAQMRWIAASTWLGGSASIILHLSPACTTTVLW